MVTAKVILGLFGMVFAAGMIVALIRWALCRWVFGDWDDANALRLAMGHPPVGGGRRRRRKPRRR